MLSLAAMTLSLTVAVVMLLSVGLELAVVILGCSAFSSSIEVLTSEISSAEMLAYWEVIRVLLL